MAYPTVNAPYGLKPINLYGGTPFAGATRQYQIASAYNTSIFYGDVVEMINDGTIIKSAITTARATVTTSQVIGVFLGCSYVNAQGQTIFAQYFPANTAAPTGTTITAFVCNDPNTLFKVVIAAGATPNDATSGLLPSSTTQYTVIGTNVALVQNTGSTFHPIKSTKIRRSLFINSPLDCRHRLRFSAVRTFSDCDVRGDDEGDDAHQLDENVHRRT